MIKLNFSIVDFLLNFSPGCKLFKNLYYITKFNVLHFVALAQIRRPHFVSYFPVGTLSSIQCETQKNVGDTLNYLRDLRLKSAK